MSELSLHVCPGGPLLVRGEFFVEGEDGTLQRSWRPVSAVCRCRKSAALPWCDGTHKMLPPDQRP